MEIYYGSRDLENYLDVNCGNVMCDSGFTENYKYRMLLENDIPYIIRPVQSSVDRELMLRFYTKNYYILERLMTGMKPDGSFLKMLLTQIGECIRGLESFLLTPGDLVLSPEYMLYEATTKKLRLIYVPGYATDLRQQLKNLLEFFMKRFDHRDKEGMQYLYEIYDNLESEAEIFEEKAGDSPAAQMMKNPCLPVTRAEVNHVLPSANEGLCTGSGQVTSEAGTSIRSISESIHHETKSRKKFTLREIIFLSTVALLFVCVVLFFVSHGDQTFVVLSIALLVGIIMQGIMSAGREEEEDIDEIMESYADAKKYTDERIKERTYKADSRPYIYGNVKNTGNENIKVAEKNVSNHAPRKLVPLTNGGLSEIAPGPEAQIIIGRGRKESDYLLPNAQISRVHAILRRSGDSLFLVDQGSTNGTFINAERLSESEVRALLPGDVISFANEDFFVS